ncbi:MAG: oligosaccharide flippase family protein [Phycisphaerales bacterium]
MTDTAQSGAIGEAGVAIPVSPAGAPERTLRQQVVRGSAWTIVGFVGTQVIRLAGNLILVHLLPQSAFGLMGLVSAFLIGLEMLSDLGGGGSVVQHPKGESEPYLRTAWSIAAVRGMLLWLIACVAALPFAWAYGHAVLSWIVPISACSALATGLLSARVYVLHRRMTLGPMAAIDVGSLVAGQLVMIGWALISPSVWALVVGGLAGTLLRVVLSHVALPGPRDRFGWDREAASAVLHFGAWIFASSMLTFLAAQSDRLIFGALIPLDLLAAYSVAVMLATMPTFAVGALAIRILYPVFSRMNTPDGGLARQFARSRRPLLIACGWVLSGMIAGGPTIIAILYPAGFAPAGWMLSVLAMGAWLTVLESGYGMAFFALGKGKFAAAANAAKLAGMIVLIPVGYRLGGFPGAVGAFAATEGVRYAASTLLARRLGLRAWAQDLGHSLVVVAASGAGYGLAWAAAAYGLGPAGQAAGVFVVATAIWLPAAVPELRRLRAEHDGAPAGREG